jgi:hypothetical protein
MLWFKKKDKIIENENNKNEKLENEISEKFYISQCLREQADLSGLIQFLNDNMHSHERIKYQIIHDIGRMASGKNKGDIFSIKLINKCLAESQYVRPSAIQTLFKLADYVKIGDLSSIPLLNQCLADNLYLPNRIHAAKAICSLSLINIGDSSSISYLNDCIIQPISDVSQDYKDELYIEVMCALSGLSSIKIGDQNSIEVVHKAIISSIESYEPYKASEHNKRMKILRKYAMMTLKNLVAMNIYNISTLSLLQKYQELWHDDELYYYGKEVPKLIENINRLSS